MPVIAMTKEMGSLGTFIGIQTARELGYEFIRNEIVRRAAAQYQERETEIVGAVERAPGLLERLGQRGRRYRAYVEAAVLEAAAADRVVLMGRWSTIILRGIRHAVRVRVCAPRAARASRVMGRLGVDYAEAVRRIRAYDEGVRARMRQAFNVDWTDPLLYDLVINTERVTIESGARQVVQLAGGPEFQLTAESRAALAERLVAARVLAVLRASGATASADVDVQVTAGRVLLAGVVGSEDERDAVIAVAGTAPGVAEIQSELKVFRRPIR